MEVPTLECNYPLNEESHLMQLGSSLHTYLLLLIYDNGFSASQEIPCIIWNPKVHNHIYKNPPPVSVLSQIQTMPPIPLPEGLS